MRMGRVDENSFERLDIVHCRTLPSGVGAQDLSLAAGNKGNIGARQNKEKSLVAARVELARVFPTGSQVKIT